MRGGAGLASAAGVAVSGSSLFLTGTFAGTADFGALTLSSSGGSDDVYVSKLTDHGTTASFVWTQRLGGTLDDEALALAPSGSSLFVTGQLRGSAATVGATALPTSSGTGRFFVCQFTDAGLNVTHNWTRRGGSTAEASSGTALAVVGTSVYAAGSFAAQAIFDATTLSLQSRDGSNVFITKLIDQGTTASFAWAQQAGGSTGYDFAEALLARGNNVYVAGEFAGVTGTFGSLTLANTATTGATSDVYVTRLTDLGSSSQVDWVLGAGYPDSDTAGSLVAVGGASMWQD